MSPSELKLGYVKLARIPHADPESGSIQVASGVDMAGLDVVLFRAGAMVVALEPTGALELGRALMAEAELVAAERRRRS